MKMPSRLHSLVIPTENKKLSASLFRHIVCLYIAYVKVLVTTTTNE